jgi:hypothetical protein
MRIILFIYLFYQSFDTFNVIYAFYIGTGDGSTRYSIIIIIILYYNISSCKEYRLFSSISEEKRTSDIKQYKSITLHRYNHNNNKNIVI